RLNRGGHVRYVLSPATKKRLDITQVEHGSQQPRVISARPLEALFGEHMEWRTPPIPKRVHPSRQMTVPLRSSSAEAGHGMRAALACWKDGTTELILRIS
ncbi:unnamed protein product, partial [Mycena citricolor]